MINPEFIIIHLFYLLVFMIVIFLYLPVQKHRHNIIIIIFYDYILNYLIYDYRHNTDIYKVYQ